MRSLRLYLECYQISVHICVRINNSTIAMHNLHGKIRRQTVYHYTRSVSDRPVIFPDGDSDGRSRQGHRIAIAAGLSLKACCQRFYALPCCRRPVRHIIPVATNDQGIRAGYGLKRPDYQSASSSRSRRTGHSDNYDALDRTLLPSLQMLFQLVNTPT